MTGLDAADLAAGEGATVWTVVTAWVGWGGGVVAREAGCSVGVAATCGGGGAVSVDCSSGAPVADAAFAAGADAGAASVSVELAGALTGSDTTAGAALGAATISGGGSLAAVCGDCVLLRFNKSSAPAAAAINTTATTRRLSARLRTSFWSSEGGAERVVLEAILRLLGLCFGVNCKEL